MIPLRSSQTWTPILEPESEILIYSVVDPLGLSLGYFRK